MTSATLIEKCCLIANPAAGNPTHYVAERVFDQQGLDWRFMTFEVAPQRLGEAIGGLAALGFHGVKVGEPFQTAAIEFVDSLSERATRSGSINVLTASSERMVGDNTEGAALVALATAQGAIAGRGAVIVGAGRLARAIAVELADAGVSSIEVAARTALAGQRLVDELQTLTDVQVSLTPLEGAALAIEPEAAIVVNATSASTSDPSAKLAIDPASLRAELIVVDVAYNSARTWLTRAASERGAKVIDGLALYVEQTALALREWTGIDPDRAAMREAAEEFLGL